MKFICDKCSSKYSIADDKIQKKVLKIKCKKCSHVIIVRDPQARAQGSSSHAEIPQAVTPAHTASSATSSPFAARLETSSVSDKHSSYSGHSMLHHASEGELKLDLSEVVRHEERTVIARISTDWIRQVREEKHEEPVWFMALRGQPHGPVVLSEVLHHIQHGEIQEDTLVWKGGWPEWTSAGSVPELKGGFVKPVMHQPLASTTPMTSAIPARGIPQTPQYTPHFGDTTNYSQPNQHQVQAFSSQPSPQQPTQAHLQAQRPQPSPQQPTQAQRVPQPSKPQPQTQRPSPLAQAPLQAQSPQPAQTAQHPAQPSQPAPLLRAEPSISLPRGESHKDKNIADLGGTSPSQPSLSALSTSPMADRRTPAPDKNLPRHGNNGNHVPLQSQGHSSRPASYSPHTTPNSFPPPRSETPAIYPVTPTSPAPLGQDIAHEKRAIPAVEFVESHAEADFFARPSSEVLASMSANSNEMLEMALPPIPLMDVPEEELAIDDADILEIRETIKPKWSARLAVAAGLGVIAVLLTLPLLLNSGQSKIHKKEEQLPTLKPWSKTQPEVRLSQKEMEARMRLLERQDPSQPRQDQNAKSTQAVQKKLSSTKQRSRTKPIRIQEANPPLPRALSIEDKIRLAFLKKSQEDGPIQKKKVETSGNIDANLQKKLYEELSAQNTRVQYCYNLHLKRQHLEGTLTLTLTIAPSGRVTNIQVNRFRGLEFTKCLIREIRYKWKFSSFSGNEPVMLESKYDLRASQ